MTDIMISHDVIDNNIFTICFITICSFISVYLNGFSILYLIFIEDTILNKKYLNNTVDIKDIEDSVGFYRFGIISTLIIMLAAHVYGFRNVFKHYSMLIPGYYVYICLFNILFISYYIIFSDDPCHRRKLLNCTMVGDNELDLSLIHI